MAAELDSHHAAEEIADRASAEAAFQQVALNAALEAVQVARRQTNFIVV
jgi:hypothetical protein